MLKDEKIKLETCPNCGQNYKIVKKCRKCGKLCCNICSVNLNCINCHVIISQKENLKEYREEKIKVKT